jgi:hypothetical protein
MRRDWEKRRRFGIDWISVENKLIVADFEKINDHVFVFFFMFENFKLQTFLLINLNCTSNLTIEN